MPFLSSSAAVPRDAFLIEKQLKKWNRAWTIRLVETLYSEWRSLYYGRR